MALFPKFCLRRDARRLVLTAINGSRLLQQRVMLEPFRACVTLTDWNDQGAAHEKNRNDAVEAEEDQSKWHALPRGPLWKGRRGSKEALLVVRELRREKAHHMKVEELLETKVARLLKIDLLAVLNELQRLNEVDLAIKIFCVVRQEFWYKPEVYLYRDMLNCLGRNKRAAQCRIVFSDLKKEGIKPNGSLCVELMAAFLQHGMFCEAIEVFDEVKEAGCCDRLVYRILLKGLHRLGLTDLWLKFKKEYVETFGEEQDGEFNDDSF